MATSTSDLLRAARVVPVIDLADPDDAPALAAALQAGGAHIAEMTLRSPRSLEALAAMIAASAELGDSPRRLIVAAGSVLTPADFDAAVDLGAEFVVSPGSTARLRSHAASSSVPFIPGISSASEAMAALDDGFEAVKFFPAAASGGPAAIKAILAPLRRTPLSVMPTGGITPENAASYLEVPGVSAVGGSWMVSEKLLTERRWDEVERLTRAAVAL